MPNFDAMTGRATLTTVTSSTVMTSTMRIAMTAVYLRIENLVETDSLIEYDDYNLRRVHLYSLLFTTSFIGMCCGGGVYKFI